MNYTIEEVIQAYRDCRKHKRWTKGQLEFELDLEHNLITLWKDLNNGTYEIGTSICFCVTRPKIREVFAACFRDRIVHHIIVNRTLSLFENNFIESTYSCRKGKGVLYGVRDIQKQVRKIGWKNYWFVKLDLSGFFMSIDRNILWDKLYKFLSPYFESYFLELVKKVVFNRCDLNCTKRGNLKLWDFLPPNKSLFNTKGRGLPIGNLTSQIFANFYLSEFDHIFSSLDCGYGRYVDDIVIIGSHKYIKSLIPKIRSSLLELGLKLNEKKTIIQNTWKGILFVGYIIKSFGLYCGPYIKSRCLSIKVDEKFEKRLNSYLGFLKHVLSYNIKRKMIDKYGYKSI